MVGTSDFFLSRSPSLLTLASVPGAEGKRREGEAKGRCRPALPPPAPLPRSLFDPGCGPPGSSVHGALQAGALERGAEPPPGIFPRGLEPAATLASACFLESLSGQGLRREARGSPELPGAHRCCPPAAAACSPRAECLRSWAALLVTLKLLCVPPA